MAVSVTFTGTPSAAPAGSTVLTVAEQIAALEAMLPKAGLDIQENGRRVRYPTADQILQAIAALRTNQRAASGRLGFKFLKCRTERAG